MAPTSNERREVPNESWSACPRCGARFRTWDCWYGSAVWVFDGSEFEPVLQFRYCPVCGRELKKEGEQDADGA